MESTVPELSLAPCETTVVTLLTQGHTDASVARELRISERSVTNIVRSIMDRVGVDNRFQLGWHWARYAPPHPHPAYRLS
jgi:DNA-binding NarL/FixJ family response regulator